MEAGRLTSNYWWLDGESFQSDKFLFEESQDEALTPATQIINGNKAGVVFRHLISNDVCQKISSNFWKSPKLYTRCYEAPANCVGTFHYAKDLKDYLDQAEESTHFLDRLFGGTVNIFETIISAIGAQLGKNGMTIRLAQHDGRSASPFVVRSWIGGSSYSLLPHEDVAQCSAPNQAGFEIQKAAKNPLVVVNICVENSLNWGNLHYWNIIPNAQCRDSLGLTHKGAPYPESKLVGIEKQVLPMRSGDVYCFNGKAVHAFSSLGSLNDKRATISFFMAKLDDNTVIYWA